MTDQESRPDEAEAIFEHACQLEGGARESYLDDACLGDTSLRAEIESMIAAHAEQGEFLADPTVAIGNGPGIGPGDTIGPYKLREQIGEGGMGVVFVAEQERPMRRKVALKVIKPGMDSRTVVARFDAERQALALMEHPNIARVLDAGTTESGRPYFVMELVRGVAITEYCDERRLPVPERLELFAQVCQAIQHAHQKGIIHRDIKPSNVLVTEQDGRAVPKAIDFGVAKALGQRLTDQTIYTVFHAAIGTPLYMSPEQAALSAVDVDTRSDVYSLGVLLYELLTGTTPFDKQRFARAAFDEVRRIISDEEASRPSEKISSLGQSAATVSECRSTEPGRLLQFLRGDLDWIVMKALEKDRGRRYETANAFGDDVERFLNDESVSARPPSTAYRFSKFARRNRAAVVTSVLVLLSLLLGVIATSWMATVATREATLARERLTMFASASYAKAVADVLINDQEHAKESLNVAQAAGASRSQILVLRGLMALNQGENDRAIRLAEDALKDDPSDIGAHALRAVACIWSGYDDLGELELHQLRQLEPRSDADRLLMAYALLSCDPEEAKRLLEDTPGIQRSPIGLLIRGFTESSLVSNFDRRDAKSADRAVRDFEYVQYLFHDSQASLGFRLHALASAIRLARYEGRDDDSRRYTDEGRPLAAQLAKITDYPAGDWSRQRFHLAVGDTEEAWQAIRKVGQHPGTYSWFLAAHCLGRCGVAALQEFDQAVAPEHRSSKYVRLARAYLLGDASNDSLESRKLVEDMLDDPSPFLRRHALLALWPVCDLTQFRRKAKPTAITGLWYDSRCLDYLAGTLTESQLLEQAGQNEVFKSNAHFTLGMVCLSAHDRGGAYRHFEKCIETDTVGWFDYAWAEGYLARMDKDKAWPGTGRDNRSE